jgi:cardiolipin synthase A/B
MKPRGKQVLLGKFAFPFLFFACATQSARTSTTVATESALVIPPLAGTVQLIQTPNPAGHPEFLAAITGAHTSIQMTMFHLTDTKIVHALIAAQAKGVDVQVIVDGASLSQAKFQKSLTTLKSATPPVQIRGSSPAFKITHEKAMIVDGSQAFITAINLTGAYATTRDFGLIVNDPAIVQEMSSVFQADWKNAELGIGTTPALKQPNLVWSPVDSEDRLAALVSSASKTVIATVENLGDPKMMTAFEDAAAKGATVRIIVPMCDQNVKPLYDYIFLSRLTAKGIQAKVMPYPPSSSQPYMHSKMILVDGQRLYIGSINFSTNSMTQARELGIIISPSMEIKNTVQDAFDYDWTAAAAIPAQPPDFCPVVK